MFNIDINGFLDKIAESSEAKAKESLRLAKLARDTELRQNLADLVGDAEDLLTFAGDILTDVLFSAATAAEEYEPEPAPKSEPAEEPVSSTYGGKLPDPEPQTEEFPAFFAFDLSDPNLDEKISEAVSQIEAMGGVIDVDVDQIGDQLRSYAKKLLGK